MAWKDPVERFLELLRLRTVSAEGPSGSYNEVDTTLFCARNGFVHTWKSVRRMDNYNGNGGVALLLCVAFILLVGLPVQVFSPVENKPVVLATWEGEDPTLPGIILNSHYDVYRRWRALQYDPFDAKVLEDGRIYGRGAQDMKSVCIQYVEAVHSLMSLGFKPKRNIYVLFARRGNWGAGGMTKFLETEQFKAIMPVAFAFDEGLANPGDAFTAEGPTGHGSRFIKNTATMKIIDICNKALAFRDEQEKALGADNGCKHGDMKKKKLGDVTTINITALQSGVSQDGGITHALNVIPTEAIAGFDIRVSPEMDMKAMKAKLDEWCAAEGVSWEFAPWTDPLHDHYVTSLDADNVGGSFSKKPVLTLKKRWRRRFPSGY
ncbi:Peptidase M20, dimerization domain [Phytophthora cactorum]|nr:Peptidase M20, dimerization domain [Phytophthora cactorum]